MSRPLLIKGRAPKGPGSLGGGGRHASPPDTNVVEPTESSTPAPGAQDYIAQANSRILAQYRESSKMLAFIAALLRPIQAIENALVAIPPLDDPDIAGGVNLDVTAALAGQLRQLPNGEVLSDEFLRLLTKLRILRNKSHVTGPEMLEALELVFANTQIRLEDVGGMAFNVAVGRAPTASEEAVLRYFLPRPMGVRSFAEWYEPTGFFGFDDTLGASPFGEDNAGPPPGGRFAEMIAPVAPVLASPLDLGPALSAWLRPDYDRVGHFSGVVSEWAARGATESVWLSSNVANRPMLVPGGLNGRNIIRFNSTAQRLASRFQLQGAKHVFMLRRSVSLPTPSSNFECLISLDSAIGLTEVGISGSSSLYPRVSLGDDHTTTTAVVGNGDALNTSWEILEWSYNGGSNIAPGSYTLRRNGVVLPVTLSAQVLGVSANTLSCINSRADGVLLGTIQEIGDIVIVNRPLTDIEADDVRASIMNYYSL